MNEPLLVCGCKRSCDSDQPSDTLRLRDRAVANKFTKRSPRNVFHRDEGNSFDFPHVKNGNGVLVVDRSSGARFAKDVRRLFTGLIVVGR